NLSMILIPNAPSHAGRSEDPALAKQKLESNFISDPASYDRAKNQTAGVQPKSVQPDPTNGLGYSFRDLSGGLVSQQLQEANRTAIRTGSTSWNGGSGNQTGALQLRPLPADSQVFFIPSPEAIRTVPFRVENIPLP
ncbi:MAG: hypothetical protein ABIO94_08455, partial [Opitutaceae bacterium]